MQIKIHSYHVLNGNRTVFPYKRNVVLDSFDALEEYRKRKMEKFPGHYVTVNYSIELSNEEKEIVKNLTDQEIVQTLKPIHA